MKFLGSVAGLLLLLQACATDRYLNNSGHSVFRRGDYVAAAEEFKKAAAEPSTNQVLFLLDEATSFFNAGRYQEAADVFLRAEKLMEIKDYTSISEEVGTLATSDNVRGYKGEDFEKVLVNVYLALSYAALDKPEDAQVEARKINLLLYRMINEGKRNYKETPFARYLSGILWEWTGAWNDAYIDYKKTFELDESFPGLGSDLVSLARFLRFRDEEREWRSKFSGVEERHGDLKKWGELVVVFPRGLSPVKAPRVEDASLPRFVRRGLEGPESVRILKDGQVVGATQKVLDIEATSIAWLDDRIGRMKAAKLGGALLKGALAIGVGKASKNEDLGWLAFYLLLAADQADLRSWRTLPASLDLARIPMPPGSYTFDLEMLGFGGNVRETKHFENVKVDAGKKHFLIAR